MRPASSVLLSSSEGGEVGEEYIYTYLLSTQTCSLKLQNILLFNECLANTKLGPIYRWDLMKGAREVKR